MRKAAKPTNVLLVLDAMTGQEAVVGRGGLPRAGRLRRRHPHEARRRRARRRGALGEGGHRQADQARLGRREARPARVLPPRPDGLAHPRHGRRADADREGRGRPSTRTSRRASSSSSCAGEFTFDDFLSSYRMLRKMGPLKGVLSMIPGLGKQLQGVDINEKDMARVEAIVLSMTPQERRMPHLIDGSRRKRIASRQRDDDPAGQPAALRPQADAEDDEADEKRQDAGASTGTARSRHSNSRRR